MNKMNQPSFLALMAQVVHDDTWHQRLGHPHLQALKNVSKHFLSLNMNTNVSFCNESVVSKSHKLSFDISSNHTYIYLV